MEDLLRELIAVNKEMLNEIRQLRYTLERSGQAAPQGAGAVIEAGSQLKGFGPVFGQTEEIPEPAPLPADATEEELMSYAASHPLARKAMRIFRAKIIGVKRV